MGATGGTADDADGAVRVAALRRGQRAIFTIQATMIAVIFFMAQFLQTGLGYDPLGAGLRLLPGWATLAVIAPLTGPMIARVGARPLMVCGMAAAAAGLAWIALIGRTGLSYWQLVAPLIIIGAGVSLAMPASATAVMRSVAPTMIGKASGTFNTLRQLGVPLPPRIGRGPSVRNPAGSFGHPLRFVLGEASASQPYFISRSGFRSAPWVRSHLTGRVSSAV